LEEQRKKQEMEGCTFQPKISARSRSAPRQRGPQSDNCFDRLLMAGKMSEEKLRQKQAEAKAAQEQHHTFSPQIKRMAGAAAKRAARETEADFLARMVRSG
jgi:hypothetical protein